MEKLCQQAQLYQLKYLVHAGMFSVHFSKYIFQAAYIISHLHKNIVGIFWQSYWIIGGIFDIQIILLCISRPILNGFSRIFVSK